MPVNQANKSRADIYRATLNDPKWQADNFVFQIVKRLVKTGKCTRRHAMALWNLYQMHEESVSADKLFENIWNHQGAYPKLSESEACNAMDERGFVWVDPEFMEGEYIGVAGGDRWEKKGWNEPIHR